MRFLALCALAIFGGCGTPAPDAGRLLTIGDSVMAWNGDRGIPEVAATTRGLPLVDASRSGSRVVQDNGVLSALGLDIAGQWAANRGRWAAVAMTGGGNDLRGTCGTADVDSARDALIGPGLDGAIPALVADMLAAGSPVVYVGYYDANPEVTTGFSACQPAFDVMNARMAALADRTRGLTFLDAGTVIDPADGSLLAADAVHPSPRGSQLIGAALASVLP
ncbi:SGNH/GDSL hydrolase family protein [Jannaschia sp. LMIT008]|uniref:SGNH/GDSL hydrolase family protein n=1 Tax=Jannaschia maritima TaxID=3032585 RepID=UPI002811CDC6|nr:SGNH/GDSL hydrolase family protein [Jannaschia sp. LMIT008]